MLAFGFIKELGRLFVVENISQIHPKQKLAMIPLKKTKPGKLTEMAAFFQ